MQSCLHPSTSHGACSCWLLPFCPQTPQTLPCVLQGPSLHSALKKPATERAGKGKFAPAPAPAPSSASALTPTPALVPHVQWARTQNRKNTGDFSSLHLELIKGSKSIEETGVNNSQSGQGLGRRYFQMLWECFSSNSSVTYSNKKAHTLPLPEPCSIRGLKKWENF